MMNTPSRWLTRTLLITALSNPALAETEKTLPLPLTQATGTIAGSVTCTLKQIHSTPRIPDDYSGFQAQVIPENQQQTLVIEPDGGETLTIEHLGRDGKKNGGQTVYSDTDGNGLVDKFETNILAVPPTSPNPGTAESKRPIQEIPIADEEREAINDDFWIRKNRIHEEGTCSTEKTIPSV